jgi:hypothetical protein
MLLPAARRLPQVLSAHCLDVLLRPGLLPPGLTEEQGAALWAQLFAASSSAERDALLRFLGYKSALQVGVVLGVLGLGGWGRCRCWLGPGSGRATLTAPCAACPSPQVNLLALLHLRRQLSGRKPEDRPPLEQRMAKVAAKVAQCAPGDPAKAGEQLQKLLEARDNHVSSQLMLAAAYGSSEEVRRPPSRRPACLCWPGRTRPPADAPRALPTPCGLACRPPAPQESAQALKDAQQRLGSKSAQAELAGALVARAAPSLLSPGHVRCLLARAREALASRSQRGGELIVLLERASTVRGGAPACLLPLLPAGALCCRHCMQPSRGSRPRAHRPGPCRPCRPPPRCLCRCCRSWPRCWRQPPAPRRTPRATRCPRWPPSC